MDKKNPPNNVDDGIQFVQYCQSVSCNTIFNYHKLKGASRATLAGNVLAIARRLGVAPMMVIRTRLFQMGCSRRQVNDIINGRELPPNGYKDALQLAMRNDPTFSPLGLRYSKERGQVGEELIAAWLDSIGIGYGRDEGQGGPDFLLKRRLTLIINGINREFDWIESKASFGNKFRIKKDTAQFRKYDIYGEGFIIYWFGIDRNTPFTILTWQEMLSLVPPPLQERIRSFIAFVPPEFAHLIN